MNTTFNQSMQWFQGIFRTADASWKLVICLLFFTLCDVSAQDKAPAAQDKSSIGQTIMSIGNVKAFGSDQKERALKRADPFYVMDKILVEASSKAQLRFVDGALINLIASTEYRVDSYVFKNPNQQSESVSTLVKGGFRAISGAIAKENITGTQVRTPLATIGLRGTIYEALLANGKLFVGCEEGKVVVSNAKGSVEIGPSSPTLYAIVEAGASPKSSKDKPTELKAVSFNVEGGLPIQAPAMPTPAVVPMPVTTKPAPPVTGQPVPMEKMTNKDNVPAGVSPGVSGAMTSTGKSNQQTGMPKEGAFGQKTPGGQSNQGAGTPQGAALGTMIPVSQSAQGAGTPQGGAYRGGIPNEQMTAEECEEQQPTADFSKVNIEEIPYEDMEGCAYEDSNRSSYLAPSIAGGTLAIVAIIALISQQSHHHHDRSTSSSFGSHSHSHN